MTVGLLPGRFNKCYKLNKRRLLSHIRILQIFVTTDKKEPSKLLLKLQSPRSRTERPEPASSFKLRTPLRTVLQPQSPERCPTPTMECQKAEGAWVTNIPEIYPIPPHTLKIAQWGQHGAGERHSGQSLPLPTCDPPASQSECRDWPASRRAKCSEKPVSTGIIKIKAGGPHPREVASLRKHTSPENSREMGSESWR